MREMEAGTMIQLADAAGHGREPACGAFESQTFAEEEGVSASMHRETCPGGGGGSNFFSGVFFL